MTSSATRHHPTPALRALIGLVLGAAAAIVLAGDTPPLEVEDAHVRAAPPGAPVLAGYLTLHNRGGTTVSVVGAESPDFERVEIHRTEIRDGVARMVAVSRLRIGPGETVRLEPGGMHLMLMRPHRPLPPGETVRVTLRLEPAGTLALTLPVRRGDMGGMGHGGHRGDHMH